MASVDLGSLRADLAAEHAALDDIVAPLPTEAWETPTPSPGWAIRDQVAHLAYFDDRARHAVADPEAFAANLAEFAADLAAVLEGHLDIGRAMPAAALLAWWRAQRAAMLGAFAELTPGERIAWYGPPMSVESMVTGRLMETWAHGQDVRDALGLPPEVSARLRHIAHLGVRVRAYSHEVNGVEPSGGEPFVELRGPNAEVWTWGSPDAAESVRGDAVDFCLVVTRRRHVDDTGLEVRGDGVRRWLELAQAYAGPPGDGRQAGQFPRG